MIPYHTHVKGHIYHVLNSSMYFYFVPLFSLALAERFNYCGFLSLLFPLFLE